MTTVIFYCWTPISQSNEESFAFDKLQYGEIAVGFKAIHSKILAYLKDFYPLDVDDSDSEYVISEMKYNDSVINIQILLLDADSIATRTTLCHL